MSETPSATEQAKAFAFTAENLARTGAVIARYPDGRQASAVLPLLDIAQRQCGGWLPQTAMETVARILDMAPIRVYEVATFHTMFNLAPVGEHSVHVCTTTPCALRGCAGIVQACKDELGIGFSETTDDNKFTLREVECLGACVNAPMLRIDNDYYEDLDADAVRRILQALRRGERPAPGPQGARKGSVPAGGLTTLKSGNNG